MYCTFFPWAIQDVSAIVLAAAVASSRQALVAAAESGSSSAFSSGSGSSEIPADVSASNAGEGSDSAAGEGSDSSAAGDSGSDQTTAAASTSTTVAARFTTSAAPASYANVTGVNASELVERAAAVLAANGGGAAMLVTSDADAAANGEVSAASFGLVSLATAAAVQGVLVDVAAPAYVVDAAASPSGDGDAETDDPVVPFWGWIIVGVGAAALVAAIIGAAVTRQRTAARVRAFSGFGGGGGEHSMDYNSGGENDGSGVAMSSYHKFDAPSSDVDLTKRASQEADDEAMRARARFMPNSVQRESVRKHSTFEVEDEDELPHQQQQPQIYGGSHGFPLAPGATSSAPPLMMHEVQLTRTWTRAATIREEDI
jgi:hypothetical protein